MQIKKGHYGCLPWINLKTRKKLFGVDYHSPEHGVVHCSRDMEPLLFELGYDAEAYAKMLNEEQGASQ